MFTVTKHLNLLTTLRTALKEFFFSSQLSLRWYSLRICLRINFSKMFSSLNYFVKGYVLTTGIWRFFYHSYAHYKVVNYIFKDVHSISKTAMAYTRGTAKLSEEIINKLT